jgi:hypothetical protein
MVIEQEFLRPETRCDFYVSEKRKRFGRSNWIFWLILFGSAKTTT